MREKAMLWALLLLPILGWGQSELELESFNEKRLRINEVGMTVLGSWALGNMAVSGIGLATDPQGSTKHFHQMNLGWNAVNLVIAGFGYYSTHGGEVGLSLANTIQEHEQMKQILLFNAGLDVAYMAGGLYLLERAKNSTDKADQWRGFGQAIIMNGGFLLAFDVVLYYLHNRHGADELYPLLKSVSVSPMGFSVNWRF